MTEDHAERFVDGEGWETEAGYSRAARRGRRLAVSGTTASASVAQAHPNDAGVQTLDALQRSVAAIAALGGTAADVIRSRLMLVPGADWEAAARAHQTVLGNVAPANTLVFVAGLVGDDYLVEVELEAEVLGEATDA